MASDKTAETPAPGSTDEAEAANAANTKKWLAGQKAAAKHK